jgi:NADH-quinone oxidoreductase subunit N
VVFDAAVKAGLWPLAAIGIAASVIGAYYYLRIVKVMYMDEPAAPYARVRESLQGLLILLSALVISPLGYLLIGPLQSLSDKAAGSMF